MAALLGPAIVAVCLASAGAAQACPSSSYGAKNQADEQTRVEREAAATSVESTDCPYAKRARGDADSMSAPVKAAFTAVPAALAAFALGWRSGGRGRRRNVRTFDEFSK
jgi:hypothetical protein